MTCRSLAAGPFAKVKIGFKTSNSLSQVMQTTFATDMEAQHPPPSNNRARAVIGGLVTITLAVAAVVALRWTKFIPGTVPGTQSYSQVCLRMSLQFRLAHIHDQRCSD